jgi:hypothetical protein
MPAVSCVEPPLVVHPRSVAHEGSRPFASESSVLPFLPSCRHLSPLPYRAPLFTGVALSFHCRALRLPGTSSSHHGRTFLSAAPVRSLVGLPRHPISAQHSSAWRRPVFFRSHPFRHVVPETSTPGHGAARTVPGPPAPSSSRCPGSGHSPPQLTRLAADFASLAAEAKSVSHRLAPR